jgi:hypothetical protein
MNEQLYDHRTHGVFYVDAPENSGDAIGAKEIFLKIIKAIGRATKNSAKKLWKYTVQFLKFVLKKLDEGADMHNRQRALAEGYRNQYPLRMII